MGKFWNAVRAGVEQSRAKRPKRSRDELEFQPASIEIIETPPSPTARIFTFAIMAFSTIALSWSWFSHVDTHVTLPGKIIPVGKIKVVEPLITATVTDIHVVQGSRVKAGELLVELDPAEHLAERGKLESEHDVALGSAVRLRALIGSIEGHPSSAPHALKTPASISKAVADIQRLQFDAQLAAFAAEQDAFTAELERATTEIASAEAAIAEREALLAITADRKSIFAKLEKQKLGIKTDLLDARRVEQDQRLALTTELGRIADLKAAIASTTARKQERKAAFKERLATELAEMERRIPAIQQDLAKIELLEKASKLRAPVSGTVQQLQVSTLGQVVTTGRQLMVIVPDDTKFEIEAMLQNKDKGFVREGQIVRIKLDAFPFMRYGTLEGRVRAISNDSVAAAANGTAAESSPQSTAGPLLFPVAIKFDETSVVAEGERVELTPGMSLQAEIKTGERRVLEFLLDPLLRLADESFGER